MLFILVILFISLTIIYGNEDVRELKYYDGDRHMELASKYKNGDSSVIRRILTHTPSRKPTKKADITHSPSKKQPTTNQKPTQTPPSSNGLNIDDIFQLSSSSYIKINSEFQFTKYYKVGSKVTCEVVPYYYSSSSFIALSIKAGTLSQSNNSDLLYTSLDDNKAATFKKVSSNPFSSCKPKSFNFKNIKSVLKPGMALKVDNKMYNIVKSVTDNAIVIIHSENYGPEDKYCSESKWLYFGPLVTGDGDNFLGTIYDAGNGDFGLKFPGGEQKWQQSKTLPQKFVCEQNDFTISKFTDLNIAGNLYADIVIGKNIVAYHRNYPFDGQFFLINYETGAVNETKFYSQKRSSDPMYPSVNDTVAVDDTVATKPFFYNGNDLFVFCEDNDFYYDFMNQKLYNCIQNSNTKEFFDIPQELYQTCYYSSTCTVGKYNNTDTIFYVSTNYNDETSMLVSYDFRSKVATTLQSNFDQNSVQKLLYKDNKLYGFRSWLITSFDLQTKKVKILSIDVSNYNNPSFLLDSSNNFMIFQRPDFNGGIIDRTMNYAAMTLGPVVPVSYSNIQITDNLLLKDTVGGYYYKFQGRQLSTYVDMMNGAAVCFSCQYMLANGLVYCDKFTKQFVSSSFAGLTSPNQQILKTLPQTTQLPNCTQSFSLLINSVIRLSSQYRWLFGSINSDLILLNDHGRWFNYNYDSSSDTFDSYHFQFFNVSSGKKTSFDIQPVAHNGYPVSINGNNDYFYSSGSLEPMVVGMGLPTVKFSSSGSDSIAIEQDGIIFALENGLLTKFDISNSSSISKTDSIPLPGNGYNELLASIDKNTAIYGFREALLMYDMTTLKTIGHIDTHTVIDKFCKTSDWELDGMITTKKGLTLAVTCYNNNKSYLLQVSLV